MNPGHRQRVITAIVGAVLMAIVVLDVAVGPGRGSASELTFVYVQGIFWMTLVGAIMLASYIASR